MNAYQYQGKGLKRRRNISKGDETKKPTYHCDNCNRDRYSPCHCERKVVEA